MNKPTNTTNQNDLLVLISLMDTYERLYKQRQELTEGPSAFVNSSKFVMAEITNLMQTTLDKCLEEKATHERLRDLKLEIVGGDKKLIL